MCKYCERRTDVKLGWDQPELPWHHNQDITKLNAASMIRQKLILNMRFFVQKLLLIIFSHIL